MDSLWFLSLSQLVLVTLASVTRGASTRRLPTSLATTSATTTETLDPITESTFGFTSTEITEKVANGGSATESIHPISSSTSSPDSDHQLQSIKDSLLTGVEAIRDSIVGLVAFLIGGAREAVERQVGKVVNAVERVGNQTILIKDNLASAGGAIVHTWGNSIRQTGNITGHLVNSLAQHRRLPK